MSSARKSDPWGSDVARSGAFDQNADGGPGKRRILLHDDPVGTRRDGCTGEDANAFASADGAAKLLAWIEFANHATKTIVWPGLIAPHRWTTRTWLRD